MTNDVRLEPEPADRRPDADPGDDPVEIRFSLTALGEAMVVERRVRRFRGFGPCSIATLPTAR